MKLVADNPWLEPYKGHIEWRHRNFLDAKARIESVAGSVDKFTQSYKEWGLHHGKTPKGVGITYKEWAPNAKELYLCGDFNGWNTTDPNTKCERDEFGMFSLFLPDSPDGKPQIPHNSKVRCHLILHNNQQVSRIPAWINYTYQNPENFNFDGVFWNPESTYEFQHPKPEHPSDCALLIYECHIGMAGVEPRLHTYKEFTRDVLPMVKRDGYNAIQVMAIMEHAYYASFGYQVTSFFAPSSRFGTPDDLKELVDTAHSMGILVFLDLVHSHAAKNVQEGLNQFDGTDHQYFHEGGRGYHSQWDSRLFNYNHIEVQRFLLSNLRYYSDVFHFDGFRFDGVTSIVYKHHGNLYSFTSLGDYFNDLVDEEAVTYLYLANYVIHEFNRGAITIAEEVSGMSGMARSLEDGGFGFDYRLGMAVPDMWIKLLKEFTDDSWNMGGIAFTLSNRPYKEKTIAYCESHDQALVGDKTLAFWLMDKEMYTHMSTLSPQSLIIDRGLALHKMIRLLTFGLGGEAYLNFMGNEFGHPEWIDFPREGNGNSYNHCRRRFDLPQDDLLKYKYLLHFDNDMLALEQKYKFMNSGDNGYVTLKHESDKIIAFERGNMLWVFNFHPTQSFEHYWIGVEWEGSYTYVISTDDSRYGGFNNIHTDTKPQAYPEGYQNRKNKIELYIPARCAFVLRRDSA
ncbi:1,4-alpha-glucan-branching enzyme [Tritrichomonas foetus]|uniref:1,4-alpha-glucan branching enzyme n=1 Tax=Tritrichomonas foetus TaxID=1144522 RepID=A0A1J4K749_9EUKA|nr:1,4-alpha-glucan-branching enzyme [Tritrichomonas foetus]|eukprot:OHT06810.1 1,4-alpha-glucan-branching enzyme [Tritrichomonas foetus]